MGELIGTLNDFEWIGQLVARLAVGTLFFLSGRGKLFTAEGREKMRDTMREAGIPAPDFNALFVSVVELVCGFLLVLGLLTPLASLLLAAVMVVAILTVKLASIEADGALDWLSQFLFLPDVLYLVILVWLFFAGAGRASVDALLWG